MIKNLQSEIETLDIAIAGKMIVCSAEIDSLYASQVMTAEDKKYIRERLASQIAAFMLDQAMIEFTQHQDPKTGNTKVRGRVFVTPDDQTRIIRTLKR